MRTSTTASAWASCRDTHAVRPSSETVTYSGSRLSETGRLGVPVPASPRPPKTRTPSGSVDRAMRSLGLSGVRRDKGIRTTIPAKDGTRAGDLLNRDFSAAAPNRTWVTDFTLWGCRQLWRWLLAGATEISLTRTVRLVWRCWWVTTPWFHQARRVFEVSYGDGGFASRRDSDRLVRCRAPSASIRSPARPACSSGTARPTDRTDCQEEVVGITVGIDWAESHHDVAVMDVEGRVVAKGRIDTGVEGFATV